MLQVQAADADLVRSAKEGDRSSFGELYSRHRRTVYGILLSRVPYKDAEDLLQTVFLQAMKKLPHLREAEAFGSWLAAIARNVAFEFHRHAEAAVELDDARPVYCSPAQTHDAGFVLNAIRRLPPAYAETLVLRLVEGMTGPEIAERTGLSPDSVRVNLCRGMKRLREELGMREHDVR